MKGTYGPTSVITGPKMRIEITDGRMQPICVWYKPSVKAGWAIEGFWESFGALPDKFYRLLPSEIRGEPP